MRKSDRVLAGPAGLAGQYKKMVYKKMNRSMGLGWAGLASKIQVDGLVR